MEKDYSEYIRKGARITLRALVPYVNKKLENTWGEDAVNKASYIWKNTGGSSKRKFMKTEDGRIKWDLGNISEFIGRGSSQGQENQKISDTETINFKKTLFPDLREDLFNICMSLKKIRDYFSHTSFDGDNEEGIVSWDTADAYLTYMRMLIKSITTDKNLNIDLERIIEEFEEVKKTSNEFISQKAKEKIIIEEKNHANYRNEVIDLSSVNILKSVERKFPVFTAKGRETYSIVLYFKDINVERQMYGFFDKDGTIEKKCRSLIGQKVITTAWDPVKYNPQEWFRNIYVAADLNKTLKNTQNTKDDEPLSSYEEMYPHDNYKSSHPLDDDIPF